MRDRDIVIAAILLWWFWPSTETSAAAAYVGWTDEGRPVPLVLPPEPMPMPIPQRYYVPIDARTVLDDWPGWWTGGAGNAGGPVHSWVI